MFSQKPGVSTHLGGWLFKIVLLILINIKHSKASTCLQVLKKEFPLRNIMFIHRLHDWYNVVRNYLLISDHVHIAVE